jgi:hypothetical protein
MTRHLKDDTVLLYLLKAKHQRESKSLSIALRCPKGHFIESVPASPACPYDNSSIKMKMIMDRWWNDTGRGTHTYSEKIVVDCHFVHHKSHVDWPGLEPGL